MMIIRNHEIDCISIIVPVYNMEKYLPQCIESILKQTYENLEILLIDDGSPDRCGEICDEYAAKDSRIIVIHQPNKGVSAARNAGLDCAIGEYIGFVDADDWVDPDTYEKLHEWILQQKVKIAACGWILNEEDTGKQFVDRKFPPMRLGVQDALLYMLQGTYFEGFSWNKLFDARIFEEGGIRFDESISFCEDLLLVCQCILYAKEVFYYSQPLYHYRMHINSISSKVSLKRLSELSARSRIIELCVAQSKRLEELSKALYSSAAVSLYAYSKVQKYPIVESELGPEILKYVGLYFRSKEFSLKKKLRVVLLWKVPVLSLLIWKRIKRILYNRLQT